MRPFCYVNILCIIQQPYTKPNHVKRRSAFEHAQTLPFFFRSSKACARSHPGLCSQSVVSNDSRSEQRMLWSDCLQHMLIWAFAVRIFPKTHFRMARPKPNKPWLYLDKWYLQEPDTRFQIRRFFFQYKSSGPSCSKLTYSLVNVLLKLWSLNMACTFAGKV